MRLLRLTKKILASSILLPITVVASPIGDITEQTGVGSLTRERTELVAEVGRDVELYDTLNTGNGRIAVEFIDEAELSLTEHSRVLIDEVIFENPNEKGQWQTQIKYAPFEDGIGGIIKISQHSFYQGQHKLNFVKFSTSKFFGSTKGFTDKLVKGKNWKAYTKQAKQ